MSVLVFGHRPRGVPSGLPAWRVGLAQWEWTELPGTALSNTVPSPAATGETRFRVEAWNGFAVIGADLHFAGVGGHADYSGNENTRVLLGVDSPGAPVILRQPTGNASLLENTGYYADGRPTSSHTYYALHGDGVRSRVFRLGVGSGWGNGNFKSPQVDAFSLISGDWDAEDTWADVPEDLPLGYGQCRDLLTNDIYVTAATKLWRRNASDASWTQVATFAQNGSAAYYRATLFDTTRNRWVSLGDTYATPAGVLTYSIGGSWGSGTLTGTYANDVAAAAGNMGFYDAGLDKYLVKVNQAGDRVVVVDPDTWATSLLGTTGGGSIQTTLNGVFGLFQRVPSLAGYALVPRGSSNVWFLASEAL